MSRSWEAARILLRDKKKKKIILTCNPKKDGNRLLKFPGGRREKRDRDWKTTAIREFREETGIRIRRSQIRYLTWYLTADGRKVVVGIVDFRLSRAHLKRLMPGLKDGERPRPVSYARARKGARLKRKMRRIVRRTIVGGYRNAA